MTFELTASDVARLRLNSLLIVNGIVGGTWKRTIKTKTVVIDAHPFVSLKPAQTTSLESRFKGYAAYLGLEPLIQIH